MAFGLRLRQTPAAEIDHRMREATAIRRIEHLLERKPRELSGGQRQRVAMAGDRSEGCRMPTPAAATASLKSAADNPLMPRWFVHLYAAAWVFLLPWALLRLLWRSRRNPDYRRHWGERLGLGGSASMDVWLHAVSVGEARAALPLLAALHGNGRRVLVTCTTPTGRATLLREAGAWANVRYLPFDAPWLIGPWLRRQRTKSIVLMETELWPGLCNAAWRDGRTLWLANARLSARSAGRYARFGPLTRALFGTLSGAAAQSADDAARLRALGARNVVVTGNLKFDLVLPTDLPERTARLAAHLSNGAGRRPIWVAGSTREGEEALLLDALRTHSLRSRALAVIVPRHPERWDEAARLARTLGFRVARRSDASVPPDVEVVIGDSLGEMLAYDGLAFAVVMGGTFAGTGGQNLIEPCAIGVPVILGPSTYNFAQASAEALAAGAAVSVRDTRQALDAVLHWLEDANAQQRAAAQASAFVAAHRGATERTLQCIEGG